MTLNIAELSTVTSNHLPNVGSVLRGYAWLVALLSIEHWKVIAPSSNLILSPLARPCEPEVVTANSPVVGLYVDPEAAVRLEVPVNP